jgi:DUF4097 and DUF4098 domain-containing protein YvlB
MHSFLCLTASTLVFAVVSATAAPEPTVEVGDKGTVETLVQVIPVKPGGTLTVDVELGAIEVATHASDEVRIDTKRSLSFSTRAKEAEYLADRPIRIEARDGDVVLTARRKSAISSGFDWKPGRKAEGLFRITVPAKYSAKLGTAGGHIHVESLSGTVKATSSGGALKFDKVEGRIDGDTSGGAITVNDCRGPIAVHTSGGGIQVAGGGGGLEADTSGGPISVKGFSGPAKVRTSGGGLTIEDVQGEISGETSGGGIQARISGTPPGNIGLETSGGGIVLKAPHDARFLLDASTSGGGVRCELPVAAEHKTGDRLKGPVNGGGDHTIRLRSSGGGIRVRKIS